MKFTLILILLFISFSLYCQPHPVAIEVMNGGGVYPDTLIFQAWLNSDYEHIADNNTEECFYPTGNTIQYLQIDCFMLVDWDAGDTLHVAVFDPDLETGGTGEYILTYENFQLFPIEEGGIFLEELTSLTLSFPGVINIPEDETITIIVPQYIDVFYTGLTNIEFSGNQNISFTPEYEPYYVTISALMNWYGSETVTLYLEDERGNIASTEFQVNFTAVNDPPVAEAGENIIIRDGESGILDGSLSTDMDGDELTFTWLADQLLTITEPEQQITSFSAGEVAASEDVIVYLTADDQQTRLSSTDDLTVTVINDEVRDLTAEYLENGGIQLLWEPPYAYIPVISYQVYINREFYLDTVESYFLINSSEGIHIIGVAALYFDGISEIIEIDLDASAGMQEIPRVTEIKTVYPNPFNPETTISFTLAEQSHIDLAVYDIRGRKIDHLLHDTRQAGYYQISWNAENIPSGNYFIRLETADRELVQKVTLLK
jgi:hypothetical protein